MVEIETKKPMYIYGNILGNAMSKVDIRTQLEAGLMSMTFMLVGLIVTGIYISVYIDFPLWYKIFLILNLVAGVIFFMSNIVTMFQQYQNYMEVAQFQEQMKGGLMENAKT